MKPNDKNGWSSFNIISEVGIDLTIKKKIQTEWIIWYKNNSKLSINSIRNKVKNLLMANDHIANEKMCDIFLCFFSFVNDGKGSSINRFNSILNEIVNSELSQFFTFTHWLPIQDGTTIGNFSIGNFNIGPFPLEIVESRCRRAGSDFAIRYKDHFRNYSICIYSDPKTCRVINWSALLKKNKLDFNKIYPLVDHYYYTLSQQNFESFFKELKKIQEIPQAFGSGWFDVDAMEKMFDTERLSIWLDMGNKKTGWVSPGIIGQIKIDFGGFHIGLPYVYKKLTDQFGSLEKSTELFNVIDLYCSYLAKAAVSVHFGNTADALLNYVIALDLLLGEKGSSVECFSTRISALTYLVLNREYLDLVRDCKNIYNARSKYVHEGKLPEYNMIERISPICREIALCLFRLKKNTWGNEPGFHEKWITYIDLLVAKINADLHPSKDDFINAGVAQLGEYCYSDLLSGLSNKTEDLINKML